MQNLRFMVRLHVTQTRSDEYLSYKINCALQILYRNQPCLGYIDYLHGDGRHSLIGVQTKEPYIPITISCWAQQTAQDYNC